ncbi:MAG: RiPP maturation radical SAM C-methyltransferase [Sulfitobacter sp.]
MRILLLSMPFGAVDRPALGLSLLKAELAEAGHEANVAYPFEHLINRVGLENYKWATDDVPYTTFVGDWCFTSALYGPDDARDRGYLTKILLDEWQMKKTDIHRLFAIRKQIPGFLDDLINAFDWSAYDLIGFTSTFVQNIASLAFAKKLKSEYPHLKIVFGGANWEDVMGEALFDSFPFVDFVCRGEADKSFPALATAIETNGDFSAIAGLLYRGGRGAAQMQIEVMDALPYPDMSDYFTMLDRNRFDVVPTMLMETSRGCWWGAKHHCTFCGLNGQGMAFRSKSAKRALAEIETLSAGNECHLLFMVDNILDMAYFSDLIPALAERTNGPAIFYETKANLSRDQVRLLAKAKVTTIQPGIESLSNRLLKLMRKGTSGLRNVQLLKWCRELGVRVEWNILYGFPGETDADYEEMLALMSHLTHLQAPSGSGPVRFDRFSPYHNTPEAFGLNNMQALPVFEYLYPNAKHRLNDIACYFEAQDKAPVASPDTVSQLLTAIEAWKAADVGTLRAHDDGTNLEISDTRANRMAQYRFQNADRAIYLLCDQISTPAKLAGELADIGFGSYAKADIVAFLEQLVDASLMIKSADQYLALGLYDKFPHQWKNTQPKELVAGE